jgi:predicted transposase YbfD/YdcC
MELNKIFIEVPDFRKPNYFSAHLLSDILVLSLLAALCGAETDEEIESYGKEKEDFLKQFIELRNGIPSHDTITRVFRFMDTKKFSECLYRHSEAILDFIKEHHISIDGKVCRATNKTGKKNGGICIVTAWSCEQNLTIGQLKTEAKSNEKKAIPELIEELDLKDALVSIDAIANNPAIAEQIVDKGGNYILSLKKNQKIAFEQVSEFMKVHHKNYPENKTVDFGSGRIETRTCYVLKELDWVDDVLEWKGIKSVIMIHAEREIGDKTQIQQRFYLSSKDESAEYFNKKIREHWSIENQLHWHLDMSFDEDRCRTKMDNGADNHNTLRKISLQILQQMTDKHSIKVRRKMAGWNNDYLVELIKNGIF